MSTQQREGVDVVAVRWEAELSLSQNGMHAIRSGATNARYRKLVGYAATYELARSIATLHNAALAACERAS